MSAVNGVPQDEKRPTLSRREFTSGMASSVLVYGLLEMLWSRGLFADAVKPIVNQWFHELYTTGQDLYGQKLKDTEFQAKLEELLRRADLQELVKFVDLDKIASTAKLPQTGALSTSFDLAQVEGLPAELNFGRQIFCMGKSRAVVPHGHENMVTGFIVLKGSFHGRHYDRLESHADHYIIRPTIDDTFGAGGVSTISDHKDNVHWFQCDSETGFIFNAHFMDYDPTISEPSGRLYLDPDGEKLAGGLIKAPKMDWDSSHAKYG
ncbi:MAG: hypothetical protein HYV27_24165 [Candidatus Hydrogenedentes bacterium]|nr:hypothetical protein [Candidatus Hydrogenedentota bacterium]